MAKPAKLVKVSGFFEHSEHSALKSVAEDAGTSVGAVIVASVREMVKRLKREPELAKRFEPDKRKTRSGKP